MRIKGLQVGPIGTNCYIVEDEVAKRAAIIDPGDNAGAILNAVVQDDPETQVACILLTHGHYDHTSAIPDLREVLPDVPVFIHKADFVDKDRSLFTLPEDLDNVHFYDEGDKVKVGNIYIEVVLHTPGHSAGSVVLKVDDVLSMTTDLLSYNIVDSSGFPFDKTTGTFGSKGSCVVAADLVSNVEQLHTFLFGSDENYTVSDKVKEISAKITNDTGVTAKEQ